MGAHMGRAVDQTLFHRSLGAGIDVFLGEARLHGGNPGHMVGAAVRRRRATIHDPRFVQMDMGFDQARRDKAAAHAPFPAFRLQVRFDGGDGVALHGDIHQGRVRSSAGNAGVSQYHIESHGLWFRHCSVVFAIA